MSLMSLAVCAVQSFLTFYVNIMDYGTVLMLQNQSNVLTLYEIPSSFSSIPSFQGVQTTGKALESVENVTLKSGEVVLAHEYGVSGFSTGNFLYQQVNVPGIVTHSNSTTSYQSPVTLSVTPDQGYQLQFTPWSGIQNQPVDSVESTSWSPYWQNGQLVINTFSSSVSVTVSNSQPIATTAPFDQFLNITESQIASALGSTTASQLWQQAMSDYFINLLFQQNGQTLYAWVQNYTSSWVAVWVKLPNGIPASSSVTIKVYFSNSIQYPYTGIAPRLTPTYGQYDSGGNVFLFYDNFAGTSLNTSKWAYGYNSGGSITVYNGVTINYTSSSGGGAWIISNYNFPQSQGVVWYASMNFYGTSNFNDTRIRIYFWDSSYQVTGDSQSGSWLNILNGGDYGYYTDQNVGADTTQLYWIGGSSSPLPASTSQNDYNILMMQILNSTGLTWKTYTITNNGISLFQSFNHGGSVSGNFRILFEASQDGAGSASIVINIAYTFLAPSPPNGVMPSITSVSSNASQYIAWRYSPISNTINATIHVTSYPSGIQSSPGIVVYSPNIGDQTSDNNVNNFQGLLVTFNGNIFYHSTTSGYTLLKSSAFPIPSTSYPFTFSVILTENSAGNVTVSTVYINSTAYTVNVNTPFPWSQIGYIGIRGDVGNLFYVSYFGVSPAHYGGIEQFVNNVESTSWKVFPYWQNGELVVNSTGASNAGQYIAWRYSPISNVINATIHVTSYPSKSTYASIAFYSTNLINSPFFMVAFYTGAVYYFTSSSSTSLATFTTPNPPFTMSVILTENSAGNVTVQSVIINGTTTYNLNTNVPFEWNQISYVGIRADPSNLFYVSYFGVSPFQYGVVKYTVNSVSLPSIPDTSSATVLISQLSNGSYALLGVYNGTWHELNLPFTSGKFTVTFNEVGPVNITLKSSNVLSYGALFSPGNGVLLEAQNAIPPSSPTTYEPLGYVGTNGEVGGGADGGSPQFTPATQNSINYYQGGTIVTTDWGTTNFTNYAVSLGQNLPPFVNYVTVGTGFTTNWANAPSGYYSFKNGFIDMAYIENNSVAMSQAPPNVSSMLFFFDPTYITQQGQYINPFTNQTYQLTGSLTREVNGVGVMTFSKPGVTNPVVYIPPFTEVVARNSSSSQIFINYDTFPYQTATLSPGNYQIAVVLLYTAYSFVLINFQGWNVTIYQNGQPMVTNDPITQQIQPFNTQGLLSAQVVANPNTKVLTIYLQPLSSGIGSYSPEEITFPQPAPQLVLPLSQQTPFSLSTLTVSGIVTVAMVLAVVIALIRANQDLLASIAAGGAIVAVMGIIIHLMPVIFIGSVLVIISTAYRFARRNSQS